VNTTTPAELSRLTRVAAITALILTVVALIVGFTLGRASADGVHHPTCVTTYKDFSHTEHTPVAGEVYIKAGPNHYSAGYHEAGWDVPAEWNGKDTSHYDVCIVIATTTTTTEPEQTTTTTEPEQTTTTVAETTTTELQTTTTTTEVTPSTATSPPTTTTSSSTEPTVAVTDPPVPSTTPAPMIPICTQFPTLESCQVTVIPPETTTIPPAPALAGGLPETGPGYVTEGAAILGGLFLLSGLTILAASRRRASGPVKP
jgi:hypothetical protein